MAKERISANEKYEILAVLSPPLVLVIAGFLGGLIAALLLSPLVIILIQGMHWEGLKEVIIGLLIGFSLLGAIAAKLLRWEYMINRESYKRVAEFHIPLVYPFFFLCLLVPSVVLWLNATSSEVSDVIIWIIVLILALGAAILSSALGVTWRFWHVFWLSLFSPVDWRAVIETRSFYRQLKTSFAEVKRYSAPLSLTIIDIDQSDQLKGRAMRKAQEGMVNIIDNNIREADAVGRIEDGKIAITMAHTGGTGASIQAKRVKKLLEEYLKSWKVKENRITLSIGIASYVSEMASYKDLIEKAQEALRHAEDEGGDQFFIE